MWIHIIVSQGQGKFETLASAEQEDPQQEAQIALQSFHLPRPIIRLDQASVQIFKLVYKSVQMLSWCTKMLSKC